jgi:hypothetical protein
MNIETKHPRHLQQPLMRMLLGIMLFAIGITVTFLVTEKLLPISGQWHTYLSAVPGLVVCSLFLVLFAYLMHHDELQRQIVIEALAAAGAVGVATMVISVSRSAIGGYAEFPGGTIMFVMAMAYFVVSVFQGWRHR